MTQTLIIIVIFMFAAGGFILYTQENVTTSEDMLPVTNVTEKDTAAANSLETITNNSNALDLRNQGLTKVPEYVFTMTDLEELNLSHNELNGSLPGEVRHLQNLKVLDISDNQFTGIPAEIGQLKNLEVLTLSNNKITGLPHELGHLSHLKILKLKGNTYSSFDLDIIRGNLADSVVIEVD